MRVRSAAVLLYAILAVLSPCLAAAQSFTVTAASASPTTVMPGGSISLATSIQSSAAASNMIVDLEIHNAAGTKLAQQYYTGVNFTAGQTIKESWSIAVPSTWTAGLYTLEIGLFTANWAVLDDWDNAATTFTVAAAPALTASASGTTIPSASEIVDTSLNVWTLKSGIVYKNGSTAGYTANVILLLFANGIIYQENSSDLWWSWNGSTWIATNNPTAPAACGTHASGSSYVLTISTSTGTTTPSVAACPYGGTQPITTTTTQTYSCTNGVQTAVGASVSTTVNSGSPTCKAPLACGTHASGSTYTLTTGTSTGTTTPTVAACPFGGTQKATITTTQLYECTNGVQTAEGSPINSSTPTGTPTCNAPPTGTFGIKVLGDKFVSTKDNSVIQLLGVSVSGLEQGATAFNTSGGGYNTATNPGFASMASWNINLVRIPLNEDTWLGVNNCTTDGGTTATLQSNVKAAVAAANAAGLYVILDLHWSAPKSFGCLKGQGAMPDSDYTEAAWTSLANTFKGNPAVMFEIFNEPFGTNIYSNWVAPINSAAPSGQSASDLSILLNGGSYDNGYIYQCNSAVCNLVSGQLYLAPGTSPFQTAGMQTMVNAIRATGATNVVIANAMGWAGEIQTWLGAQPTDPIGQLAAGWHEDGGGQTTATTAQAILAAGYPIIITEAYNVGSDATGYVDPNGVNLFNWATSNKVGYSYWAWVDWPGGILVNTQQYAPNALGQSLWNSYCSLPAVNVSAQCQ